MADLKEEPEVDNTEINQEEEAVEKKRIDPSLQGLQLVYEKNKKTINYVGGALAIIIGALCFFKFYYLPEQDKEAANEVFWAQDYFEKDSFNLALKGGPLVMSPDGQKQMKGFEQIAEDYSMTRIGNLCNYYAGICYLRTGKFDQAIEYLSKFDGNDDIVAPIALGAIGDCHMEMNRVDEAIKYYIKASDKSSNSFTTPFYLKKAGFAYEQKSNYAEALSMYERIQKEYPRSSEAQDMDKLIAKMKALGNL